MTYVVFVLSMAALAVMAVLEPRTARPAGWLAAIAMALFAGLRGTSVDYDEYLALLQLMERAEEFFDMPERLFVGKDPLFGALLALVVTNGWNSSTLFLISAVLGVGLKLIAFERAFGQATVALFVSLCTYYFLHDFTQVRVAIALGWCYWAFVDLHRQRTWRAAGLALIGVGFHASTVLPLIYFPLLKLRGWYRWLAAALATLAILVFLPMAVASFGEFGNRGEIDGGPASVSWVTLALAAFRFALLLQMERDLRRKVDGTQRAMLNDALLLCAVGTILMFGFRGVTAAMAFRSYEVLDAFSVFIVAAALSRGHLVDRSLGLLLCVMALTILIAGGLLVPYTIASF